MKYKELFVLRHAKSSWDDPNIDDIDRALTTRGIADAYSMANRLKKQLLGIDLILTSYANRAEHTATIFASTINYPVESIKITSNIYETSEVKLTTLIKELPNELSRVLIVGHNPTFTYFANRFLQSPIDNIPTTGIVGITFRIDTWNEISIDKVHSSFFEFPKKEH